MGLAPQHRLPRTARSAAIENAAARLFAERGYRDTRLEDIAAAMDITKPIIYRHFRSKKELYLALLERHVERQESFAEPDDAGRPLATRLPAMLDAWFALVREYPNEWQMIYRDSGGDADIKAARLRAQKNARVVIEATVGVEAGLSADELHVRAELIRAAMGGLAIWSLEHPDFPPERLVDLAARTVRTALDPG